MPGSGATYVTCETGASDCSDRHEYRVICVESESGLESCSCFRDATFTAAFDAQGSCPNIDQVNSVCGWQLAAL